MNSYGLNSKDIVNNVNVFQDSSIIDSNFRESKGMNNGSYEYS